MGAHDAIPEDREASPRSSAVSEGDVRRELLPRPGSAGSPDRSPMVGNNAAARRALEARTESGSLHWPSTKSGLLRGRSDFQDMLDWQSGEPGIVDQGDSAYQPQDEPVESPYKPAEIFGMDARPFFPALLMLSLLWSMCMIRLQSSVEEELFGAAWKSNWLFFLVYAGTIGCMAFTALSNPGMMDKDMYRRWAAGEVQLPKRAHKHWLYKRPILRFHQYCRWITNAIGLANHRQYIMMLVGLVTISVMDVLIDFVLVLGHLFSGAIFSELVLILHLVYSGYFAWYTVPLLRQHAGFVARNELTQEYKRDDFYIVYDEETGEAIWVNELDADEYNEGLDNNKFVYDCERNPWDKGWAHNCWVFWCMPRSSGPGALGEF
mmetsp:Transcript_15920/g.41145  ORF Transcript_15920/g.41145 Transcript_15920/m.41145 type:complete len:378 (-) Transcript_15920:108-1241(-)